MPAAFYQFVDWPASVQSCVVNTLLKCAFPVVHAAARILTGLALVAVALFCVFGFLASFEPGNGLPWKVGYGVCGAGSLFLALRLFLWRTKAGEVKAGRVLAAAACIYFLAVLLLALYAMNRACG